MGPSNPTQHGSALLQAGRLGLRGWGWLGLGWLGWLAGLGGADLGLGWGWAGAGLGVGLGLGWAGAGLGLGWGWAGLGWAGVGPTKRGGVTKISGFGGKETGSWSAF